MLYRMGIDVGGTFTDFVATRIDNGELYKGKTPTIPNDEASSILNAVTSLAEHYRDEVRNVLANTETIVLGTTVVTNTMLEYSGVPTGLLTTKGFRDIVELRRGYKESLFDLSLQAPHPIVRRRWRKGIAERIDSNGEIIEALNEDDIREAVRELKAEGCISIAVCFLFSFVNRSHECRAREIILEEFPECFVSLSCEILPQIREFERVSTTIVNAYTSPKLSKYLYRLKARLTEAGFGGALHVMQSNGGVMDLEFTASHGVEAVLSGPSGGVVAAMRLGENSGYRNIITADMGGTSYDVCLVHEGKPEVGVNQWISRYRIAVPLLDIHTIGAGGGSIAWVDSGGALRVGPASAGATPGPACYRRGGDRPTVTDANLVLGYIDPTRFLGGKMTLDIDAARGAIEKNLGQPLGIPVLDAAIGISRIANTAMANALRFVSISRGRDPRDYALMAFGGAGAISAGVQAVDVGIKTILVPRSASVLSALGGLMSDFKVSKIRSHIVSSDKVDLDSLNDTLTEMNEEAEQQLKSASATSDIVVNRYVDVRYAGQVQEVIVPIKSRTRRVTSVNFARALRDFHDLHETLYGFKRSDQPVEIVTLRLELTVLRERISFPTRAFAGESSEHALVGTRQVYIDGLGMVDCPVYEGALLRPGNLISGPAVIHEPDTTIVVYDKQEAMLDQHETYVVEVVS